MSEGKLSVWLCSECGEYVPEHYSPPMRPGRGHFHDNPDPNVVRRIFHPAEEVEVIPVAQYEGLKERLREEIAKQFERLVEPWTEVDREMLTVTLSYALAAIDAAEKERPDGD